MSDLAEVEAPLEPNINHRATAFGGSLSALAILAGWAMVHFRLRGDGVEVELTSDGCGVAGYTGTYVALERSAADAEGPRADLPPE